MSNITVPDEREKEISAAVGLLKMEQDASLGLFDKAAVSLKLRWVSTEIRSLAQARLRGEQRLTDLRDVAAAQRDDATKDDPAEVAAAWEKVKKEVEERKTAWLEPTLQSEIWFQMAFINYSQAMNPLMEGLEAAKGNGVDLVDTHVNAILVTLEKARATLLPISGAASQAVDELRDLIKLVDYLIETPPITLVEVQGVKARFAESVQAVRNSEDAIKKQTADLDTLCADSKDAIELHVKAIVAAAVAHRESTELVEDVEWAKSLLTGVVGTAQRYWPEPVTGEVVQGLHTLIGVVCDGISQSALFIKTFELSLEDAVELADKLEADDIIQAKLAAIETALEWAAEPLGLIPNVGDFVREAVTSVAGFIIGILQEAATSQAEAAEAAKKGEEPEKSGLDDPVGMIMSTLEEQVKEKVQAALQNIAEGLKLKPAELAKEVTDALLGDAFKQLLVELVPAFDLAKPDEIKKSLTDTRNAVATLKDQNVDMGKIVQNFGFDEAAAKSETLSKLEALGVGQTYRVKVAQSDQFVSAGGVALLIGDNHSKNNQAFIGDLIEDAGAIGTVTKVSAGGMIFKGELIFDFSGAKHAAEAQQMVTDCVRFYGGELTRYNLTFGPKPKAKRTDFSKMSDWRKAK
jgi:hypothetical protein